MITLERLKNGQGDNYTTGCLLDYLDYLYIKELYKLIAIDLSKQQKLMLIEKQYDKLILLENQKKQKKQF